MEQHKQKGHHALRRGRLSLTGARYFITIVTNNRQTGLNCQKIWNTILQKTEQLENENLASTVAMVVMPDHLHWILIMHSNNLSSVIRKFKGRLSPVIQKHNLVWQKGSYYDHRLRFDENLSPYLRYLLSNPYRSKLVDLEEKWPFWFCCNGTSKWFIPMTNNGRPYREWLDDDHPVESR